MEGKKFSHYIIQEKLGEGGMGVVYKAQDTTLDRTVALKFLSPHAIFTPENKARFAREAKAAASLLHPNVATIFEYNEAKDPDSDRNLSFIAMEYVGGQTLTEMINEQPQPIDKALEMAISIAEALAKAHEKNITHRDIKSDNIMVSSERVVKVMDFGLAQIKGNTKVTKEGTTVGTIAYMSPEQAQGDVYDHRSDLWSFGVVLYEILTGILPFQAAYEQALIYQILNEDHKPLKEIVNDIPTGLNQLVQKLLQKDPSDRYQTMNDVIADLKAVKKEQETGSEIPDMKNSRASTKLAGRLKPVLISAAVLIIIAMATWFFMPSSSKAEITSLAVLPFENITANSDQEYFADGMTDQLITELSKISALRITSRTSSMQFKGKHQSLIEIANILNVDGIITATVFRSGERMRLNASLIRVSDDMNLWSDSFERNMEDILDLTATLAKSIAGQINASLTQQENEKLSKQRKVDPEAFDLVARGNFIISSSFAEEDFEKALEMMFKAVSIDPGYVQAHAGVAWAYTHLLSFGFRTADQVFPQAKSAIDRALELDPDYGLPYTLLARLLMAINDMDGALKAHEKAIELSPNDGLVRTMYSWMLMTLGKNAEGIHEGKIAVDLDPLSMFARCNLMGWYYADRQYAEAKAEANRILELNPNWVHATDMLRRVAAREKRYDDAVKQARKYYKTLYSLEVQDELNYEQFLEWEGNTLTELMEMGRIRFGDLAVYYAEVGDNDKTMYWLHKAEERNDTVTLILFYPEYESLRDDPRFEQFVSQKQLPINVYCQRPAGNM